MLREELTGYSIPVPFNVKSNNVTINFQTDDNNWSIPNFGYGNTGRWALNFTVIYPTITPVQDNVAISSTITTSTSTIQPDPSGPTSLGYTCTAECNF